MVPVMLTGGLEQKMTTPSEIAAIGIVTVSDRASGGMYRDISGPAIEEFLRGVLTTPWRAVRRLIPDGIENVRDALIDLAEREKCALVFTTDRTSVAGSDTRGNDSRVHEVDARFRRTDAVRELETSSDRNFVPPDRRHSGINAHH